MAGTIRLSPARISALEVVRAVRERDAYAQDILQKVVDSNARLSSEDRAFATLLSMGVVQTRGTLDELINLTLKSPKDVKPRVRDALEIATYEIIFLNKAPHAAVSQGVELVRHAIPKATKLANYVLRRVADQARSFPFGDPNTSLDAAARLYGFPLWLARKLEIELGFERAQTFMAASNEQAPLFFAVNTCKTSEESVEKVFAREGELLQKISLSRATHVTCYKASDSRVLLLSSVAKLLEQGKIIVADAASQAVVANTLPDVQPASALEVGAGRGTKTVLFQANALTRFGSQMSHYTTLDNASFKTKLLRERAQLCYCKLEDALTGDATNCAALLGECQFDFVFVDAPCSGLGTLRRHPEIRWRVQPSDIQNLSHTQLSLLRSASAHVAAGGVLAYATCTVTSEENAQVVKAFLSSDEGKGFELMPITGKSHLQTMLASGSSDAHFAVRFRRMR